MHRRRGRFILGAALLSVAVTVASCGNVLDTVPIADASGKLCDTAGGAYFLPKRHIHALLEQAGSNGPYTLTLLDPTPVADRRQHYCLDYLGSPAAHDKVEISRTSDGLLQKISTEADDRSKRIAETIIEAGLIAATGNPNIQFRGAQFRNDAGDKKLIADFSFDPFDERLLAEINTTLLAYGYCVYVGQQTYDPRRLCSAPASYALSYAPVGKAPAARIVPVEESRHGILYRPNMTHQIIVLRRRDPGSRERWKIHQVRHFELPNISPVLSIPVNRSFFVKRETILDFNAGVLEDVTIKKPSELLAASELPLKLAQAIVDIPAQIIKVRIAATDNRARLIDAQSKLIATQLLYEKELATLREKQAQFPQRSTPSIAASVRATQFSPDAVIDPLCAVDFAGVPNCKVRALEFLNGECSGFRSDPGALTKCVASRLSGSG